MLRFALPISLLLATGIVARSAHQETPEAEPAADLLAADAAAAEISSAVIDEAKDQAEVLTEDLDIDVEIEFQNTEQDGPGPDEAPVVDAGLDAEIRVFALRHAAAKEVARLIQRLYPDADMIVDTEERTNHILIRSDPNFHERISRLIQKLDQASAPSQDAPNAARGALWLGPPVYRTEERKVIELESPVPSADQAPRGAIFFQQKARRDQRDDLRKQLAQQEQHEDDLRKQVAQQEQHEMAILTDQIRHLRQATDPDDKSLADLEKQLRERVREAFEARQQLQRTELATLQQQLASIEATIAARDHDKERLVEQRVKDLLSGKDQVKWDVLVPAPVQGPFGVPHSVPFPPPPEGHTIPRATSVLPATPPVPPRQQQAGLMRQQEALIAQIQAMEAAIERINALKPADRSNGAREKEEADKDSDAEVSRLLKELERIQRHLEETIEQTKSPE